MTRRVHIVIAEPSVIIRSGMVSVLKRVNSLNINIAEIADIATLETQIVRYKPDILIVNPSYLGVFSLSQIKSNSGSAQMRIIALQHGLADSVITKAYDQTISLNDTANTIQDKLLEIINSKESPEDKLELSSREKEIVICVAKGYSNKQIASQLNVSTHTVMTHRRNIASKLQIHSPSGLTIYAIVNKLIDINDIKETSEVL